jgi:hypothetical protein
MTGYESKRAAARDKLVDDRRAYYEKFDDLYAVYLNGVYDGKKAAQPEEEKLHPVSIGVDVTQAGTSVTAFYRKPDAVMEMFYAQFHPMPQPAQEPVAWLCSPDENGLFELPTTHKACKDCFPVYTAPPQRPWVGLTKEAIAEFGTWYDNREEETGWVPPSEIVAYIDDKLRSKNNAA